MIEFIKPFIYGFIVGILWMPALAMVKKVIEEFKLAKEQWHGKPD